MIHRKSSGVKHRNCCNVIMLPHQSTQPPSLNLEPAGCETIIYRLKRLMMAEDTYELRLEQEGFHIIPVQGGEVGM